ncbi:CDP-glucose 4,6-dehydratase [Paraburkholderia sp. HC6.4b]|uniref:CDP-glucose 4,6-dehydratase n=1 Tax=unclassified Paraburkholderia TaxID=2615204 RepID=UPI0018279EBA|nr:MULTISPECIES: CDP-glucose 4,6-dehydratase [unclassified Paraburkholderia]MBB5408223.1 CDP-glucose 4,6-dehydratase [Paraburkholderia sp. HC6.4b]MBB5453214.1 CDP-glucose 4,6-dehydratase [Paraburkholderia sp. Kb1A]
MADYSSVAGLVVNLFSGAYLNRRVLLTGHTGFKGSWLALWLTKLGAHVTGASLAPATTPNHWDLLKLDAIDHRIDIRDPDAVARVVEETQPEIVFHLAAQALVRRSYAAPVETWATNVMGTCHVLEACRMTSSVKAIVAVTTDKCYENNEWVWGYRECDRLGGNDPYSASKAATELVVASYRSSLLPRAKAPLVATARAGNVIGGGDWSEDRLIPDLVRAMANGTSLEIRSPNATRPWQHVLESLSGYLLLGEQLLTEQNRFAEAWNFGPDSHGNRSVSDVLRRISESWPEIKWHMTTQSHPHEARLLSLDSTKARTLLGWQSVWGIDDALRHTSDWYRAWLASGDVVSARQLDQYVEDAAAIGTLWCGA